MGDRTRIAIVAGLATGPRSVGDLAKDSGMALPSFLQHLHILERAELVSSNKVGRVRICQLRPETLSQAHAWIGVQRSLWDKRLQNLDAYIKNQARHGDPK